MYNWNLCMYRPRSWKKKLLQELWPVTPPGDILWIRRPHIETLGADGMLYPLNDVLNEAYWASVPAGHRDNREEAYKVVDTYYGFSSGGSPHWNQDYRTGPFIIWNQNLFEREGLPSLYELQEAGEWNWDNFLKIAQEATKDTTGDGEINQYGFTTLWPWLHILFPICF